MKALIALFLTFLPLTALAATVDTFECILEVDNLLTQEKTKETRTIDVARRPEAMAGSPSNESRTISEGHGALTVTVGDDEVTLSPVIQYNIALMTEGDELFEARQLSCNYVGTSVCSKDVPHEKCFAMVKACLTNTKDPFDPDSGWPTIPVVEGVPVYDSQQLNDVTGTVLNPTSGSPIATYHSSCQYKGTID